MDATCRLIFNGATPTPAALAQAHGDARGCYQLGRMVVLDMPGAASDPRPGFLACAQPGAAADDYCGVGLAPVIARDRSYAEHWQFLPFPAGDAKTVGEAVVPQQYWCLGNASQTWAFHFDTLTYTRDCAPPPTKPYPPLDLSCDEFLYFGVHTTPDQYHELYQVYGKATPCMRYGNTIVGVVAGNPQPGVLVCGASSAGSLSATQRTCGFELGSPGVDRAVWRFVALPSAVGPVDSATFDTAAGTACLTVGAQSFAFTLATMAVTPGCGTAAAPVP